MKFPSDFMHCQMPWCGIKIRVCGSQRVNLNVQAK